MIAIRKKYGAIGGRFIVHSSDAELIRGLWLTGPVPRIYPEHNWAHSGKVLTASGLVEDNIPEIRLYRAQFAQGTGGHYRMRTRRDSEYHYVCREAFGDSNSMASLVVCICSPPLMKCRLDSDQATGFHTSNLFADHCTGGRSHISAAERPRSKSTRRRWLRPLGHPFPGFGH